VYEQIGHSEKSLIGMHSFILWNFPYPIKLEIINDKAIKELSLDEGYFL